jgi:DnaJ-class molecular chaperone
MLCLPTNKNTCSEEEITTAFRNLALQIHPDKNKSPRAHKAFVGTQNVIDNTTKMIKCF